MVELLARASRHTTKDANDGIRRGTGAARARVVSPGDEEPKLTKSIEARSVLPRRSHIIPFIPLDPLSSPAAAVLIC